MVSKNINNNETFSAIVIIGPTASGKTDLAHKLFDYLLEKNIKCELVNLDAFQIYKNVSAGTAKPNSTEIKKYMYHCLDILNPNESLDANSFANLVTKECKKIFSKGHIPICVGGSGLYLRAFLHGLDKLPPRNDEFRKKLRLVAKDKGWPWCHDWLKQIDPVRAAELHPNDKTRIERALEISVTLGVPMSSLRSKTSIISQQNISFSNFIVHLEPNSEFMKERIKLRVPKLFENGWIREIHALYQQYNDELLQFQSMKAIGYSTLLNYYLSIDKKTDELINMKPPFELLETITTQTWHYAKKQRTWNAKEKKDFILSSYSDKEFIDLYKNAYLFVQNNILNSNK